MAHTVVDPSGGPISGVHLSSLASGAIDATHVATLLVCQNDGAFKPWATRPSGGLDPDSQAPSTLVATASIKETETEVKNLFTLFEFHTTFQFIYF